jgi:hypothetical protein
LKITLRTPNSNERVIIETPDNAAPPTMIKFPGEPSQQIALDWSGAVDDEKSLKHCPVCGCKDMYVSNNFPQVTVMVTIALAAVFCQFMIFHKLIIPAIIVASLVIIIDVLIYIFKKPALICYDCQTEYRNLPISKHHGRWEHGLGERYKRKRETKE